VGEVLRRIRGVLRRETREPVRVDLEAVLRDALHLVRPDARERGIELELLVAPGLPAVMGDDVQLAQVFLNLLVNALDAADVARGEAQPRVRVLLEASGAHLVARVEDSGPGVPEANVAVIFEPFVTTKRTGLGMGLAITRSIVEAHHGAIAVGRSPLGGAAFEVRLPAARGSASARNEARG
jgi:signal transduction histidine kinase